MVKYRLYSLAVAVVLGASTAAASPLIDVEALNARLGDSSVLIVDIRPEADFLSGHIPGAVGASYPGTWRDSDWRFRDVKKLEATLSALGVERGKAIVLVPAGRDATELGGATSVYWLLKYLGHDDAAILDGGWRAWADDAAIPIAKGDAEPVPSTFRAELRPALRASTAEVEAALNSGAAIVDARSEEQFLGEAKSGLVSRAGRIPGAVSVPFATVFDPAAHRLKHASDLKALLPRALQDERLEIITYCNTGHWGSIDWFVLHEVLQYPNVRLYDGSMAAWTSDPGRPVEAGPPRE